MPTQSKTERVVRIARFIAVSSAAVIMIVAIMASMPTENPQTDAQQSALQKLTPAQAEWVRPLLRRSPPPPGGEIHGFVTASLWEGLELRDGALPRAQVFVETAAGAIDQQSVTQTDSQGRFHIPWQPQGVYNVCASLSGFAKSCFFVPVVDHNVTLPEPIALQPLGTAIRGCVTLKDGTPAVRAAASSYESAGAAEVSAESGAGDVVAGPVPVNAAGCYVLPGVKATVGLRIVVRYEQAAERLAVPSGALDLQNHAAVNLVLSTSPPTIASFTATLNGKEVSQAPPGSTVAVDVKAASPNNYPLRYTWADSTGTLLPGDQPSKQWKLPRTSSQNLIFVEVSDGHGGVARASLAVVTGPLSTAEQSLLQRLKLINRGAGPKGGVFGPLGPLGPLHHSGTFIDPSRFMGGCSDTGTGQGTCAAEAENYYQAIGVYDASNKPKAPFTSFKAWKAFWGFSDDPTNPKASETRAVYYNDGDLQFGRDMHCIAVTGFADPISAFTGVVINVCYVANYSDGSGGPGGDPQTSITNAENNNHPIAAVAMVGISQQIPDFSSGRAASNAPYVFFIVFTPPSSNDPNIDDFVPNTQATLDSEGAKAVPGVCIACHGGTYSTAKHNLDVSRFMARFLPFDTPSFRYDQVNNKFSEYFQRENFRHLNQIARNASTDGGSTNNNTITSQTVRDLISGWYSWCGGVDNPATDQSPGCSIDERNHPFIPSATCTSSDAPATCGWNADPLFYQEVPRRECRTCHVAHSDLFNWQNYAHVTAHQFLMCSDVQGYRMPFAEVPYNRFWNSSLDRSAFATFANCQLTPPGP